MRNSSINILSVIIRFLHILWKHVKIYVFFAYPAAFSVSLCKMLGIIG